MIITVTPNPSLDLLFRAERLVWDDANRIPLPRRRAGGQGINVVRAVRTLAPGTPATAVALLGGGVGRELSEMLALEATPLRAVPAPAETRVFVGVRESETGRSLLLNPRGAAAGDPEAAALVAAVESELDAAEEAGAVAWVAGCGSLPPGMPVDLYARLSRLARGRGHRYVPDTDGEGLRLAAEAGCDLLVPNVHEAERLLGRSIRSVPDAAAAARDLLRLGPRMAVVTLGGDGAVGAWNGEAWLAAPELDGPLRQEVADGSAVGAGDALLAALLLRLGGIPEAGVGRTAAHCDGLADGVAAGTAALLSEGGDLVSRTDAERVRRRVHLRSV